MPPIIFSVWNVRTRSYDYYQGGQSTGTHAGAAPTPLVKPAMGATPDEAAWRLPPGSTKIGSGDVARGRIASLGDDGFDVAELAVPMAIGIGAWWFFWRNR